MNHWYCIYTKPNKEEFVCWLLRKFNDIELFNPKLKRKRLARGQVSEIVEELFPCYVFSRFNPLTYYHLIKYTKGVKRIVGDSSGNPYAVDPAVINEIKAQSENGYFRVQPIEFQKGDPVMVKEGPFQGLEGIFLNKCKASERISILLNLIKSTARVEIEKCLVAKG
ncbi:MAG: transcription termination/antitermination NusG family protein [Thermodesulfobacteriota bacterium]|jgi:transcriptional antiterminator RfaH